MSSHPGQKNSRNRLFPLGLKINTKNSNSIRFRSLLIFLEFQTAWHVDFKVVVVLCATKREVRYDWDMQIWVMKRT